MTNKNKPVEEALAGLAPHPPITQNIKVSYSNRFNDFNASVRLTKSTLDFRLSSRWSNVDDEIVIGLMQVLLARVLKLKIKKETLNMRLYHHFIRALSSVTSFNAINTDKILEESFNRVNERYFTGVMDRPNIIFSSGRRTLGSYNYATDTLRISIVLKEDTELLDYVMYHELLHRFLKYRNRNSRTYHHTKRFREMEKRFENYAAMEHRLKNRLTNFSRRARLFSRILA